MEGPSWGINAKTVINIICSRNIAMGTPVFRGVKKNVYMIDFQTSAVCRARVVQCSVNGTSSKEKYDLRALDQSTGTLILGPTYTVRLSNKIVHFDVSDSATRVFTTNCNIRERLASRNCTL